MILVDTSAAIAALFTRDPAHEAVAAALAKERGPFIVSPFVIAELDYLVLDRFGVQMELTALAAVRATYELTSFDAADLQAAMDVIERYEDHEIGVADASLVVLAHRYRTRRVLTLDRRHFRVLRGPGGKPFTILPDES